MMKYLFFTLIVFLVGIKQCSTAEECEKTKAPEINFKFLLGGHDLGTHNIYYDQY